MRLSFMTALLFYEGGTATFALTASKKQAEQALMGESLDTRGAAMARLNPISADAAVTPIKPAPQD
jgi:hypothetical protein